MRPLRRGCLGHTQDSMIPNPKTSRHAMKPDFSGLGILVFPPSAKGETISATSNSFTPCSPEVSLLEASPKASAWAQSGNGVSAAPAFFNMTRFQHCAAQGGGFRLPEIFQVPRTTLAFKAAARASARTRGTAPKIAFFTMNPEPGFLMRIRVAQTQITSPSINHQVLTRIKST